MEDDHTSLSQTESLPVLAGRYPKRHLSDESCSPSIREHGHRKRLISAPPENSEALLDDKRTSVPLPSADSTCYDDSTHEPSAALRASSLSSCEPPKTPRPSSNSTSSSAVGSTSSASFISPSRSLGWKAGDHCLALYEDDKDYYEAIISRLRSRKRQQTAEVVFVGYEEDGHVVIDVEDLRPLESLDSSKVSSSSSPNPSSQASEGGRMFVHGSAAKQHADYMKHRYGDYDVTVDEEPFCSPVAKDRGGGSSSARARKSPVVLPSGSSSKSGMAKSIVAEVVPAQKSTPKRPAQSSLVARTSPVSVPTRPADSQNLADTFSNWEPDGFSEDDLEKPKFQKCADSAKVPYIISAPGVKPAISIPAPLNQYLRDYQRDGAKFLFKHFEQRQGCVLGDDMGLGKTVQVIAFMTAVLGKANTKLDVQPKFQRNQKSDDVPTYHGVFLVVTPASVLYNWEEELKTWSHLKSRVLHGSQRLDAMELARTGNVDVILTTYDTAKLNLEFVNSIDWLAGVFDEAHRMKDPKSQTTQLMKALRLRRRIGLTGTAMQNSLTELWCLLDWCNPGCLGNKEAFEEDVALPMMTGQRMDSTKRELATSRQKQKQLQEQLGKWFLRRTKALIADQLPKKEEYVVFCPWTQLQYSICQALLECDEFQIVLKAHDPCPCNSGRKRSSCCYSENSQGLNWKKLILPYLSLMMKAACHLGLLLPEASDSANQKHKAQAICSQVFSKHRKFLTMSREAAFLTLSDPEYCGKMQVLEKLLRRVKSEGSRVLLFSFRTKILNLLQAFLQQNGYTFCRLDGSVPTRQRTVLVRSFNKDPGIFVFLASKSVGGVGLNITGANVVIIFDPDWNPAVDSQAQDRAFRLGQHRDVHVYRLITQGSVEENAYLRQVYKQQMINVAISGDMERRHFTAVMGLKRRNQPGRIKGELFSFENMFVIRQESNCLTEDILKRTARVENGILLAKDEVSPAIGAAQEEKEEAKEEEVEVEVDLLEELSQAVQNEEQDSAAQPCRQSPRRKTAAASTDDLNVVRTAVFTAAPSPEKGPVATAVSSASTNKTKHQSSHQARDAHGAITADHGHSSRASTPPPSLKRSRRYRAAALESTPASSQTTRKRKRSSPSLEAADARVSGAVGAKTLSAGNLLVGASRAERRMSRHAMRDVFDKNQLSQQPANCIVDESSDESDDLGERAKQQASFRPANRTATPPRDASPSTSGSELEQKPPKVSTCERKDTAAARDAARQQASHTRSPAGAHILVGQTPPAVRRQHFERLATLLGCGGVEELARQVVDSDPSQRRQWLELLYGLGEAGQQATEPGLSPPAKSAAAAAADSHAAVADEARPWTRSKALPSNAPSSGEEAGAPTVRRNRHIMASSSEAEILAEDSADSQVDPTVSNLVSPLRRHLRFRGIAASPQKLAGQMRTVIPESESLSGHDGPKSPPLASRVADVAASDVARPRVGVDRHSAAERCSHDSKRPDAEELFASFLSAEFTPAGKATEDGAGVAAAGARDERSNVRVSRQSATATAAGDVADHDLELAGMLFG